MACVNPDGTVTVVARRVLAAIAADDTVSDLVARASLPAYRVRASLRELEQAGFITQEDDRFELTDEGRRVLAT